MIEEGTRVILIDGKGTKHFAVAERRMVEVKRLGTIDGVTVCDSSFGDDIAVASHSFRIMKPSVMDVLGQMNRRAQIISPKDSFHIPMYMDLGCGSRVVEAGAGSGALTIVLLKAVAPTGTVFTYEIREDHARVAEKNIGRSDFASCWQLTMGDICQGIEETNLDGVVLDIPNPWDALSAAASALRAGGHVCSYVPNANQLETTVKAMREVGFQEVFAFETLQREMMVHERGVRPSCDMMGHTGYLALARKMKS